MQALIFVSFYQEKSPSGKDKQYFLSNQYDHNLLTLCKADAASAKAICIQKSPNQTPSSFSLQ